MTRLKSVARRERTFLSKNKFEKALKEYVNSEKSLRVVAEEFKIAASTLSRHQNGKNLGVAGRKKGLSPKNEANVVLLLRLEAMETCKDKITVDWIHENLGPILKKNNIENGFSDLDSIGRTYAAKLRKLYFADEEMDIQVRISY